MPPFYQILFLNCNWSKSFSLRYFSNIFYTYLLDWWRFEVIASYFDRLNICNIQGFLFLFELSNLKPQLLPLFIAIFISKQIFKSYFITIFSIFLTWSIFTTFFCPLVFFFVRLFLKVNKLLNFKIL